MFYVDLKFGVGSEQNGIRPAVVIQNDTGNKHSNTLIIAVITGRADKPDIPTHYHIKAQQGLDRNSIVLLEQIRTVDKTRLKNYIGTLDGEVMENVDKALAVSVGLS